MKLIKYFKYRCATYVIYLISWAMLFIFMTAFQSPLPFIIIINVILLITVISTELWEFLRKKNYYDKLLYYTNELDKKYLISEMLEYPNFYEGEILYDMLQNVSKSMYEHVSTYQNENVEFQEYIELWIHEIKLPIASLQLMCHNDNNSKYLHQLKRVDDYIENVLYYARSRTAEKDYIIKPVSLKKIFTETAIRYREELQERKIKLHTENLDVKVMTDSKWLLYILGQLMGNSMKYIDQSKNSEIKIYAENYTDKTILHFFDNGVGIPDSDLPYVFEKSFTGSNGHTNTKSTGIGLYIVKKLCDKLGHNISINSKSDQYTDVIIIFGKHDFNKF